jgi:putative endonuclease
MASHNELGKRGENLATNHLIQNGYTILERNWHFERSEIDIIAEKDNEIVIVEVKTRSTDYFGYPEESVSQTKIDHLATAAEEYLIQNDLAKDVRFDIVSVLISKNSKVEIHHIEDAFRP